TNGHSCRATRGGRASPRSCSSTRSTPPRRLGFCLRPMLLRHSRLRSVRLEVLRAAGRIACACLVLWHFPTLSSSMFSDFVVHCERTRANVQRQARPRAAVLCKAGCRSAGGLPVACGRSEEPVTCAPAPRGDGLGSQGP